jgi:hypothetical protein
MSRYYQFATNVQLALIVNMTVGFDPDTGQDEPFQPEKPADGLATAVIEVPGW